MESSPPTRPQSIYRPLLASNWCYSECQLAQVDFEWTIPALALSFNAPLVSTEFSTNETPRVKWSLNLNSNATFRLQCSQPLPSFPSPSRAKFAILNSKRELKFVKEIILPNQPNLHYPIEFFSKEDGMVVDLTFLKQRSLDFLPNGNLTVYCKIEQLVVQAPQSGRVDNSNGMKVLRKPVLKVFDMGKPAG